MRNERGFTLIEILVSVAIFAMIVIGALGVLGATEVGGFLEGFPTGIISARVARDITAASVFLQAFQEYAATKEDSTLVPGSYCEGVACSPVVDIDLSGLTGHPDPPGMPYQLDWRKLEVDIERWYACFDTSVVPPALPPFVRYSKVSGPDCTVDTTQEYLVRLHSALTWRLSAQGQPVDRKIEVERFLP